MSPRTWSRLLNPTAILAVLMILALAFTGCAAPPAAPAEAPEEAAEAADSGEAAAPAEGEEVSVRLGWWGNEPRHNLYNDLADTYEELNPNITLEREFSGWGPYWEKLATQVAGGNAPDILHMHPNHVNNYGGKGALMDLTPLVESGQIDLSKFSEGIIETGAIDGKIYMITLGNSAPGFHYNTRMLEEAGVEAPADDWTWSQFVDTVTALDAALPDDVYAIGDNGGDARAFRMFLLQRGKTFFGEEGSLGFEEQDLIDYWQMWEDMRAAGILPDAAVTQENADFGHADSMLAKGEVAMRLQSGNQHKLYQVHMEDELGLVPIPHSDDEGAPFEYQVGGAYISLAAETPFVDEGAEFINWFINDPDVALTYNGEHGPPGNNDLAKMVADAAEPADQRLAAMMAYLGPAAVPIPPQPEGGSEALSTFTRIYEELSFGGATLEEAAALLFEEADFILN